MSARLVRPHGRSVRHLEEVWGTVVMLDIRDPEGTLPSGRAVEAAVAAAVREMHWVDEVFSTFRQDSEVSRVRRGDMPVGALDAGDPRQSALHEVIERCWTAHRVTEGAFDPWSVAGGFDPSGLVKGWAAQRLADLLVVAGFDHLSVNAGGEVATRGLSGPDTPWRIGIRHPDHTREVAAVVVPGDGMVATSGRYERGVRVRDPDTGAAAAGARSATVIGPDGGLADALSTALLITGRAGAGWFDRLPGWSAFVVDPDPRKTSWVIGPAFGG